VNLATIPAEAGFLDTLAARWRAAHGSDALARGVILLPTRRSARALAATFVAQAGGRPLLLPRIAALGAPDEAPLVLAGELSLPPAVDAGERLGALAALVLKLPANLGGGGSADRALALARELAALMDEAERAEVPLAEALTRAADADYALHWQVTLRFLRIVTEAWPAWLIERGLMNPAARQVALLRAQARAWEARPPAEPVWVAGTTAGIPAVAELLRVVAALPQGQVVLPALDQELAAGAWAAVDESHPQGGMKRLLAMLGAEVGAVARWSGAAVASAGRVRTLSRALLPAAVLAADWRASGPVDTGGLWRLEAADEQEEALAIALILRQTLESPGARAALVTPDRVLALRVVAELGRFGVVADDSAGEELAATPPAVFLRLLAQAVLSGFAPVPLLALLKHPLAAVGLAPAACRARARQLELGLRGPKPPPGLAGLRTRAEGVSPVAVALVAALEKAAAPLLRVAGAISVAPADLLRALLAAAEAVATTDTQAGAELLWSGEEGEALAQVLAGALPGLGHLPAQPPEVLPGVLEAVLEGAVVRSRRALRGREGREHPRVFVWGLLEARLQSAEVLVLGGLVEGVWPPATDPGPWMSRPMRARAGLPGSEEAVGQAAHDFFTLATAAPTVVLSSPRRRDGAPAVRARWLVRLEAFLRGRAPVLPVHPAAAWARALDQPVGPPRPARPPTPRPPLAVRPRRLSVTDVETWVVDPYALYARHILRLLALPPLEQETDAADYGVIVHRALHDLAATLGTTWPADGAERARQALEHALERERLRRSLAEWWRPRLRRIADWVAEREAERRQRGMRAIAAEASGEWELPQTGGFRLRGRADRIECRADGMLAIVDYKTGEVPTEKAVAAGFRPQLLLEAAMARAGAFGPSVQGEVAELLYWQLSGRAIAGRDLSLFAGDAAVLRRQVDAAAEGLRALIRRFDRPQQPYLARPHPQHVPRFSDYAQLARVAEWDLSEEEP
jgi:ATP-dependent helicase/nuclease subunit B